MTRGRWLVKAALQGTFSALPHGDELNYLFQRRVTRGLPRGRESFDWHVQLAGEHLRRYVEERGGAVPPAKATFYEFGAGWDLIGPLTYWALGVGRQVLVDIRPNVRWELVNHTLRALAERRTELEDLLGVELRTVDPAPIATAGELEERFGIRYLAPCDARATGLPAGSVDFVSSTYTLEHIPARDIAPILRESARLLKPDGLINSAIDLNDHYSFFQPGLSPYNFLRFREPVWRWLSPSLHYQNRLREPEYRALFEQAGLEIVEARTFGPTGEDLDDLARLSCAPRFRRFTPEELGVRGLRYLARPREPGSRSGGLADSAVTCNTAVDGFDSRAGESAQRALAPAGAATEPQRSARAPAR